MALVVAVSLLGVWAAGASESFFGCSDDGRIVIDEVAGQLLTLTPLFALSPAGRSGAFFFSMLVTGFVVFRLFDVLKPWPVDWAERSFKGGWGVMADDLVAGLLGGIVVWCAMGLLFPLFHVTP